MDSENLIMIPIEEYKDMVRKITFYEVRADYENKIRALTEDTERTNRMWLDEVRKRKELEEKLKEVTNA